MVYESDYPPADQPTDGLMRLQPVTANTFRMDDGEMMVFELGDDGEVWRVRRRYDYIYPLEP